jgi:hypothetical protein
MNKKLVLGVIIVFIYAGISNVFGDDVVILTDYNIDNCWIYDEETGTLSIEFSGETEESYILKYGLIEKSEVGFIFNNTYSFSEESRGLIETSFNHGKFWNDIKEFNGFSAEHRTIFNSLTSTSLWIRFTVESSDGNGFWRIWNIDLIGDTRGTPPVTHVTISGPMIDCYWCPFEYPTRIYSYDYNGVKEIHYLLDGKETIVKDDEVSFTLSTNGVNIISWWAVDVLGNEELPRYTPPFRIDTTKPEYVKIIPPEPGVYISGLKTSIVTDKVIFIGGFFIEAEAYDNVSDIYKVEFYLDDIFFSQAVSKPYIRYCGGIRHWGEAEIKVIAEDLAGNFAIDRLNVIYYNYFD